ncbi:MAG: hypothetical protein PWP15_858 [Methanothermococcus sp.]|jgi:membrane-associated protease RseP (regulator of RpoE activity)|uniref:site-2 protease family protein n=1 Tax=Methanothermococcus TaxID=155862 RepID=UPI00037E417A|nr:MULTISPECIES: site-2 protease family protein [Methanothermococcus]MDK2790351.1 hypothetical protein [Methanothermococcus sp.]MDK2987682.1 hypothetical protein [Methanothermococcus sp.]
MAVSSTTVLLLFIVIWTILYLINLKKDKLNVNLNLQTYIGIFGILRTQVGMKIIKKVGKYPIWQKLAIACIPICILISIFTFYSFMDSTLNLFNGNIPKESSKPVIFLFGSLIPWIPGVIALIIGITFHELAHGIVAYSFKQKIKSTGLLLLLGIPLGAFVEIGDDFKNASKKTRGAIASAGPMANIIIFLMVLLITPYFYGISTPLTIATILDDSPAYGNLIEGDVIYSINGKQINSLQDFYDVVKGIKPNEKVKISILRNDEVNTLELVTSNEGKIGIIVEPSKSLTFVLQTLFWTSMLNMLLGFFNLLPALPLDGYHVWNALPELIRDLKKNSKLTAKVSKYIEYIINEKNLNSISLLVWMTIFVSMAYSFL